MKEHKIGVDTPVNRGNAGKGRPRGAPNKINMALKELILGALDEAGGQKYLVAQAEKNPTAFMALVGKVLPMTIAANVGGKIIVSWEK
jgi:hypothetical protein